MQPYQRQFFDLAIAHSVLRFGAFTLKSGRVSPYFFNAGLFNSGRSLAQLGQHYAEAIVNADPAFDMLFGPAYKGIPLVAATAIALAKYSGQDYPWAFNRKEVKDHGEGGVIVGAPLQGRVLIVDDVMTAGTAVRESLALLAAHGAQAAGVVVALDRQERGQGELSAIQEVERRDGIPVIPIAGLDDLLAYLAENPDYEQIVQTVHAYRQQFGVGEDLKKPSPPPGGEG